MKKKTNTDSPTSFAYQRFRDGITLYTLGMDELATKLNREAYGAAHPESSADIVREIKVSMSVADASDEHFNVVGKFDLFVKTKAEQILLSMSVVMSAHFHTEEEGAAGFAEDFANTEGRLIFWPYFRQTVSDVSSRMYIAPITVPLITGKGIDGRKSNVR